MANRAPFPADQFPRRHHRVPDSRYLYLFDGDQWSLTPGQDIGPIHSFRSRLSRMCQDRGLRHRTAFVDGVLWVEIFRETPGDLLRELDPEVAAVPPGFSPWQ